MKRVQANETWSLFCPINAPKLLNSYGKYFDRHYIAYEASKIPRTVLNARTLWREIIASQIETGGPFILYKDSTNSEFKT